MGRKRSVPFTSISSKSSNNNNKMGDRQRTFNAMFIICFLCVSMSQSFQLTMDYQPPVKSSVKKLHDRRFAGRDPIASSTSSSKSGQSQHHQRRAPSSPSSPASRSFPFSRRQQPQSAHAGTYAPTPSSLSTSAASSGVASFERRMRDLVLGNREKQQQQHHLDPPPSGATHAGAQHHHMPSNVKVVDSLADYKQIVGEEQNKMVCVRFYAPWCKACQAVAPMYYKLAMAHPDTIFVDVPVTSSNSNLHQGLGVPSLPYGHIYHPQCGLVEEMKLTRKYVQAFGKRLDCYIQGYCELPDDAENEE